MPVPGVVVGFSLGLMNIMAIPIDGASVNPARSLGPAVVQGRQPLSQLWVFLLAPMIGAVLAAGLYLLFHPAPTVLRRRDGQDSARPEPGAARELSALWPSARGGETIAR